MEFVVVFAVAATDVCVFVAVLEVRFGVVVGVVVGAVDGDFVVVGQNVESGSNVDVVDAVVEKKHRNVAVVVGCKCCQGYWLSVCAEVACRFYERMFLNSR